MGESYTSMRALSVFVVVLGLSLLCAASAEQDDFKDAPAAIVKERAYKLSLRRSDEGRTKEKNGKAAAVEKRQKAAAAPSNSSSASAASSSGSAKKPPPSSGSSTRKPSSGKAGPTKPATATITQTVQVKSVALNAYVGAVKQVYEAGYAVAIGIWDSKTKKIKAGNKVTSKAAKAARRAGIKIIFTATVSSKDKVAAEAASKKLAKDTSALVAGVTKANTDLKKSVKAPTKTDLTVKPPTVKQSPLSSAATVTWGAACALLALAAL